MEAKLIKIDRNGSKHFEGETICDRCSGRGWYAIGVLNDQLIPSHRDNAVCYSCRGAGKVKRKWIERTPEYQAKLDAKRREKLEAEEAKREAERAEREAAERAKREAEEARIKAEKAISRHVGQIGERVAIKGSYVKTGSWLQSFGGFETVRMYVHTFKDADGNVFTWKTQKDIDLEYGENVDLKGTVKAHDVYKDEKQTALTRCKITAA